MPFADQVPVKCPHSTMRWRKWVVLIAESTGSALRAVRPFQPSHHAGCPTRSLSRRECDGLLIALAPGHHRPHHSGDLVGERDGRDLGGPTRQQCRKPGPVLGAMDFRVADHGKRIAPAPAGPSRSGSIFQPFVIRDRIPRDRGTSCPRSLGYSSISWLASRPPSRSIAPWLCISSRCAVPVSPPLNALTSDTISIEKCHQLSHLQNCIGAMNFPPG